MTKEQFIEETRRQMKNICDPKRRAANRCRKGSKEYTARERKAKLKLKRERNAKS